MLWRECMEVACCGLWASDTTHVVHFREVSIFIKNYVCEQRIEDGILITLIPLAYITKAKRNGLPLHLFVFLSRIAFVEIIFPYLWSKEGW